MRHTLHALLFLALCLAPVPAVSAPSECRCRNGNACYHFLNAPVSPPNDPCSCPFCRANPGQCEKVLPDGWDLTCAGNNKLECFLRRHAASWRLSCSERLAGTCACKNPHPEWCPSCGSSGHAWDDDGLAVVGRQMEVERRILGERTRLVIVKSPHFYVVTDIPRITILTQERVKRTMDMHELAHVFAQRAELAYEDFVAIFGDRVTLPRPSAIYLLARERVKQEVATKYFGLPQPELYYGGEIDRIGGGYPYNGCAISYEKYDSDDWLHFQVRHLVGHLLVSCWVKVTGNNRYLPRWFYEGTGHWLSRLPEKFREMANFCTGEGSELKHSGEKWAALCAGYAVSPKSHLIQRIFDVTELGGLDLEMNVRAWSWFDLFLAEDRARFVAFLAELREGTDARSAMKKTMGITPEEFDARWRDRILGKRPSVAPTVAEVDAAAPEAAGAADRAAIRAETDPKVLAARIRALGAISDPLTAETIVPLLASSSPLVRETVVFVLGKTNAPAVLSWLRGPGLAGFPGLARAGVLRVLANLRDREAVPAVVPLLSDAHWLVRAHAARALAILGHDQSVPAIAGLLRDPVGKVRVAALGALAAFGKRAAPTAKDVADELGTDAWQVRSAAAECLGEIGDMATVDDLIARMVIESGRVREDIHAALRKITRDDLGRDPANWREWWDKEKARLGSAVPPPPGEENTPPKGEIPYAEEPPTFYGMQVFSKDVGYVIDTSGSMAFTIQLDPAWLAKYRRGYPAEGTKFAIARRETEASLATLDPRCRFGLYFFRTFASRWENGLVPATAANRESALRRLDAERPPEDGAGPAWRTNYVDVFRLVLDVKAGADPSPAFGDTPDTIYFLTDGKPTEGDIIDADLVLPWLEEENRFARVLVNVIAIGQTEVDPVMLTRLAKENGGSFVQILEKPR